LNDLIVNSQQLLHCEQSLLPQSSEANAAQIVC